MRKLLLSFIILFTHSVYVLADEGMWIVSLLNKNIAEMQKMGLKLSAEDIYSVNNSSMKDAIIQFGRGCTGEIISSKGLVLTNHHCGYGQIQAHSTVDHDYLTDGFWAENYSEELPNPGLTARFLVRIEDVTTQVLATVTKDMDEVKRTEAIESEMKNISKKASEDTDYETMVRPFFDGNAYYLFVYEIFKDVRLVGAPPSSIGKFGADTDNWMWPRHTCDFSLFRIYMSPDGKPAEYSKDNVPFKPKHHLPISMKGLQKNDFVMIMGYPGTTDRYLSSFGVENDINFKNPTIVNIRNRKLEIMREYMDMNTATRIQYASKYAQTANYWKYFIGQTAQLKNNNVGGVKTKIENDFTAWVNANPNRKEEYGSSLNMIKEAYSYMSQYEVARWYYLEGVARGPEVILFSYRYTRLIEMMKDKNADPEKLQKAINIYKDQLDEYF
ncbi:MAG: S46 family peptidase, partial [Bacteroidales bacterium]|nr:S46 family peptidase [Bacteroidales bacterium]